MIVSLMQPYFFPYVGYFALIDCADQFVIYDDVQFRKGGRINRNSILVNGSSAHLTLPLQNMSANKLISETFIAADRDVRSEVLRKIENAYRKAPYYASCIGLLEELIRNSEQRLSRYLGCCLKGVSEYLRIRAPEFLYSSEISGHQHLSSTNRVLEICKLRGANTYVNPPGGRQLYSKEEFSSHSLELFFVEPKLFEYKQFDHQTFIPNLSIIDAMMFIPRDTLAELAKGYRLIS